MGFPRNGPGEFGLPHNLVTDCRGGLLTDRDNQRIQVSMPTVPFLRRGRTWDSLALFMTRARKSDGRRAAEF